MPALANHQSASTTKMLLIGNTGAGKSGSLASLADAGYNLRIIDMDNGIDILRNLLTDPKSIYSKDSLARVEYETVTDQMKNVNGKLIPSKATAWQRAVKLLENWKTESADFGPITTWTPKEVLVIDGLTFLSNAAMNFVLSMNARLGQKPHQSDWFDGQMLVEGLLQMLYDEGVKCNVIIMAHIVFLGEEGGPLAGYPATLGSKFPPKVGRYFNSVLMAKASGSGAMAKNKIYTRTQGMIELKTSAPGKVQPEYPLETGLAQYFKDIRS